MEIRKLKKENMKEIMALYADIKTNSHTFWEDDYPNEEIVNFDIERNGLYGGYENGSLVAICFAGQRCEDGEENFTWKQPFKKRASLKMHIDIDIFACYNIDCKNRRQYG